MERRTLNIVVTNLFFLIGILYVSYASYLTGVLFGFPAFLGKIYPIPVTLDWFTIIFFGGLGFMALWMAFLFKKYRHRKVAEV